ncbi:MAG: hypothetical protein E6Q24_17745 [Chitinophagaceae bacterium]|nr:MAG: hypothetical protein E6Q24_17745 [Chitinophagaceae bacterium]
MNRRDFIQLSGSAAASILLPSVYGFGKPTSVVNIENLIIGSGYGGAVTALRLAQAGQPSTILEMGLNWNTTGFQYKPFSNMNAPGANSTWLKNKSIAPVLSTATFSNKFTGVLDRIDYDEIKIYLGRGVGGGSCLNPLLAGQIS